MLVQVQRRVSQVCSRLVVRSLRRCSRPPRLLLVGSPVVVRSFLRYSRLCPYTLSRVESDVFELNGLDSLEELEQTLAGHGGLLGAMLDAPAGTGRFVSGFWAISEKYWQRIHYTLSLLLTKYVLLTTCKMSSWRGTTTRNSESRDFWII